MRVQQSMFSFCTLCETFSYTFASFLLLLCLIVLCYVFALPLHETCLPLTTFVTQNLSNGVYNFLSDCNFRNFSICSQYVLVSFPREVYNFPSSLSSGTSSVCVLSIRRCYPERLYQSDTVTRVLRVAPDRLCAPRFFKAKLKLHTTLHIRRNLILVPRVAISSINPEVKSHRTRISLVELSSSLHFYFRASAL